MINNQQVVDQAIGAAYLELCRALFSMSRVGCNEGLEAHRLLGEYLTAKAGMKQKALESESNEL